MACALLVFALFGCGSGAATDGALDKANAAIDAGEYDAAVSQLKLLADEYGDDLEVRRLYASALAGNGENEAAIEQYRAALAISAEDTTSLYEMAMLERTVGAVEDSMGHLEKLVDVEDSPSNLDELARSYMQVGRYDDAAEAWGRALDAAELSAEAKVALLTVQADAFISAKRYDEAKGALEDALFLAPNDEGLKASLAQLDS